MAFSILTPVYGPGALATTADAFVACVFDPPKDGNGLTRYSRAEVAELAHWLITLAALGDFGSLGIGAQMLHETNFLRFTGDVPFGSHNFAGLGATGGVPGRRFDTIQAGVEVVFAHHAVYCFGAVEYWPEGLRYLSGADPRYMDVLHGTYAAVDPKGRVGQPLAASIRLWDDYRASWAYPGLRYPESVTERATRLESYATGGTVPSMDTRDDSLYEWHPSPSFGYWKGTVGRIDKSVSPPVVHEIDRLIIHTTEGSYAGSLGWLMREAGNDGSSTHYLISKDGSQRAQLVLEANAAWTDGNRVYNLRAINIEHEGYAGLGGFSEGMLWESAQLAARIMRRHPGILFDRQHIQGHYEVPDQDHTDPGSKWPWEHYMELIGQALGTAPLPQHTDGARLFLETGYHIGGGFKGYWEGLELEVLSGASQPNRAMEVFGYPQSEEFVFVGDDGKARHVQLFERNAMLWIEEAGPGKDVVIPHRYIQRAIEQTAQDTGVRHDG